MLQLLHPDDEPTEKAIRKLVDTYKTQFKQEAVLRTRSYTCASFYSSRFKLEGLSSDKSLPTHRLQPDTD